MTRDILYGAGATTPKLDSENDAISKILAGN
jgi:hypothetical protein